MSDEDKTQDSNQKTFPLEYVKELREENKSLRISNTEYEKKQKDSEKQASEALAKAVEEATTKAKAEALAEATTEADKRVMLAELKGEAVKSGLLDLDQLKIADLSGVKYVDGKLDGAETLFKSLKETKPYLFGENKNSTTTTQTPPSVPPAAKHAKDMSKEEYSANLRAVIGA